MLVFNVDKISEDHLDVIFPRIGLIIVVVSLVKCTSLIYELISPKKSIIVGVLVKVTPVRTRYREIGYRLIVDAHDSKKTLYVYYDEDIFYTGYSMSLLLKPSETYRIEYFTGSKFVTEIENTSHIELNEAIETSFNKKRVSKKERKRASNLLNKYSKR